MSGSFIVYGWARPRGTGGLPRADGGKRLPPIGDYEAWHSEAFPAGYHGKSFDAKTYRFIANARRSGTAWSDIARARSFTAQGAKKAWTRLPEHLR